MFGIGWLPVIGPIIDGIVSMFKKVQDTKLGEYVVDGQVRQSEVQASVQTLTVFKDDIGVRLARDIFMYPTAIWAALSYWDKIVEHRFPNLVWETHSFHDGSVLAYLPYAVMMFLFGNLWINRK